ncbi:MAG TPA: DUF4412 domain-containing protein [Flavobacteriales bacterium]|nr:DUF4412 domain-containing protein [Flavobacteriales bacterium]
MRLPITLFSSLALLVANAQVDINKIMQERMQQHGAAGGQGDPGHGQGNGTGNGGVRMQDDNDPFVPNEFIGSFRMEMHHYKADVEEKNSPTNMRYWSTTDMTLNHMELPERKGQTMKMLTDLKGKWSYMLVDDGKGKRTAMKSHKKKVVMEERKGEHKEPTINVTSETKVIEGHTCTKVIVMNEDGTWTGWVAKDVKAPFAEMMRANGQRGSDSHMKAMNGLQGMPLEFEWAPTDGKSRMVCYIKDLVVGKVDASVFSLDGYEVMEMPSFGR